MAGQEKARVGSLPSIGFSVELSDACSFATKFYDSVFKKL